MRNANTRLVFFFTRKNSLDVWNQYALYQREVALYRRLAKHLDRVSFLTYGGEQDLKYQSDLPEITILPTPKRLASKRLPWAVPFFWWKQLKEADLFKTNQINGSAAAVWAKRYFKKKLIVRCNYLWSVFTEHRTDKKRTIRRVNAYERFVFQAADAGVVTCERDCQEVVKRHAIDQHKLYVIPDPIDTKLFAPPPHDQAREQGLIVFVARLSPQKNLGLLLEALAGLRGVRLLVIGRGSQEAELREKAERSGVDVEWRGVVSNFELPALLHRAELFVIPSWYEGLPKTLLEAMSCGLACVGTDVEGIREVIHHGQTGWLCKPTPRGLREAIELLLSNPGLRTDLGRNARREIETHYALDRLVEMELDLFTRVLAKKPWTTV